MVPHRPNARVLLSLFLLISVAHASPVAIRQSRPDVLIDNRVPLPASKQSFRPSVSPRPIARGTPSRASPAGTGWFPTPTKARRGLNTSEIIGIAVGVLLSLAFIALVWWLCRKRATEQPSPARPHGKTIGPYGTPEIRRTSTAVMADDATGVPASRSENVKISKS